MSAIPEELIEKLILSIRGQRVMLDETLSELYGVATKNLNKAVQRNMERFPADFMFQLSDQEVANLRCQFGTSSATNIACGSPYGGRRYKPYAFTEHGILMLSSVLNSPRAVQVNIDVMRAFLRMRELLSSHKELSKKLSELETRYDAQFKIVFQSIRELIEPKTQPKKQRLGF